MKITNKFGVPGTLEALAKRDYYTKGKADYSVTELISPPRVQRLRRRHWEKMESDVSDMLWSLMGSALHVVAERGQAEGHITEQRLFHEVDGITISGAIDVQQMGPDGITIIDYKFTKAWSVMADKPEWEAQQNIYAWLVHEVKGQEVAGVQICALVRDWSRLEALRKPEYPQAPIHIVKLPLWPFERTEAYVRERIRLHNEGRMAEDLDAELPRCSPDEQWRREPKFAVMKEGRKRALRVLDTEDEAIQLAKKEGGYVERRKSEPIRCTGNYCGVRDWCSQYHQENPAGDEAGGVRPEAREE